MSEFYPPEVIELPSKGRFYEPSNPLSKGTVELYYMTARHEDIIMSTNLIKKNIMLEKLFEELLVDKTIKFTDLLIGDQNALIIAARIMAYGKNYEVDYLCDTCNQTSQVVVDLEKFETENDEDTTVYGKNELEFTLPFSKAHITFKLPTVEIEKRALEEALAMARIKKTDAERDMTTRLSYIITSVNGDSTTGAIRKFVNNMPARDAREFRNHIRNVMPNVNMRQDIECPKCGAVGNREVALGPKFFWPDIRL
jgi:hypothetical protein